MRRNARLAGVVAAILLSPAVLRAESDLNAGFAAGVRALQSGAFEKAIDQFEHLADSGRVHPDVSYNRGLAYAQRAAAPQARPGDFGRAAAGFAECLELRPADAECARALEFVRGEVARREARQGEPPVEPAPSIARALVSLLPENAWAALGACGSLVLSLGLLLLALARTRPLRLAALVIAWVGAPLFVVGVVLTAAAAQHRRLALPAVVVAREARLMDESGRPLPVTGPGQPTGIPEASSVWVLARQGNRAQVEWGNTRAWVDATGVRVLSER
jgi:hypothetical protein